MKGWVYIITNKAMPDLVKVGFSRKNPILRASELNNTGAPHPYLVEFDLLVEDPYKVEQKAHKILSQCRENKEWFRCERQIAIEAIRKAAGSSIIYETFVSTDELKSEAKVDQQPITAPPLSSNPEKNGLISFIGYWIATTTCAIVLATILGFSDETEIPVFIFGFLASFVVKNYFEKQASTAENNSLRLAPDDFICINKELSIEAKNEERRQLIARAERFERTKNEELERAKIVLSTITCNSCGENFELEKGIFLKANKGTRWPCPNCKNPVPLSYDV